MFGRDATRKEKAALKKVGGLQTKLEEIKKRESTATPAQRAKDAKRVAAINRELEGFGRSLPKSARVQKAVGEAKMGQGDFRSAGRYAEQGLKHASPDGDPILTARLLVMRGTSRWVAGNMSGACSDGEQAYEMDPDNRGAFELGKYSCGRGPRGKGSGKSEKTERLVSLQDDSIAHTHEEWAERQEKNPTPAGRLALKAIRAHRGGDLGQALSFADAALKADPGDPMARFQRGYLRGEINDHNGAITDLTEAITLGWKDKVLFKLRGSALLMAGRNAAALEDAEMAVALSPRYAAAYYLRATAKLQLKRPIAEVLADLKIAAELEPDMYGDFYRKTKKDFAGMASAQRVASPAEPGAAASAASKVPTQTRKREGARAPAEEGGFDWSKHLPVLAVAAVAVMAIGVFAFLLLRPRETQAVSPPAPVVAPRLDEGIITSRYERGRLIGEGGMGRVYEGVDKNLGRPVAIKVLQEGLQTDKRHLERMESEWKFHLTLGSHPNIVELLDIERENGQISLIFENVKGRTLEQVLSLTPGRRMSFDAVHRIVEVVCGALDHAHSKNVIHRDLKPSNIMVAEPDGQVRVMDFGVARAAKNFLLDTTGTVVGTPFYMAPEQMDGKSGPETDLYALAICAYELLSGSRPFEGKAHMELKNRGEFEAMSRRLGGTSAELDAFFKKALDPEPGRRFRNGAEFAAAFARLKPLNLS